MKTICKSTCGNANFDILLKISDSAICLEGRVVIIATASMELTIGEADELARQLQMAVEAQRAFAAESRRR